eukprot:2577830-Rhodomonas_salina.4
MYWYKVSHTVMSNTNYKSICTRQLTARAKKNGLGNERHSFGITVHCDCFGSTVTAVRETSAPSPPARNVSSPVDRTHAF